MKLVLTISHTLLLPNLCPQFEALHVQYFSRETTPRCTQLTFTTARNEVFSPGRRKNVLVESPHTPQTQARAHTYACSRCLSHDVRLSLVLRTLDVVLPLRFGLAMKPPQGCWTASPHKSRCPMQQTPFIRAQFLCPPSAAALTRGRGWRAGGTLHATQALNRRLTDAEQTLNKRSTDAQTRWTAAQTIINCVGSGTKLCLLL